MMLRILCLTMLAGAAVAQPRVVLGPVNENLGLSVPSAGDGMNEPVEYEGRSARLVSHGSGYMYVRVDAPEWQGRAGDYYLTMTLYDHDPVFLSVQYDADVPESTITTRYRAAEQAILLLGAGGWVRRTVRLPGAALAGRQNNGASLRLAGRAAVGALELTTEPPAGWDAESNDVSGLEPMRHRLPAGQQLTVGNDVDQTTAHALALLGVTAVETYVTWQTVEDAGRGQWDWSRWDAQVEILEKAGLKWMPFLIAGPAYATPKWYRESEQHVGYVDLTTGQETLIESLWSPYLKPEIERFLRAFWARYGDRGILQSVLLGITGTYGESIYPAGPSGGWTTEIPGDYYNGVGWWAGDRHAQGSFRAHLRARYETLARLNAAWSTRYAAWDEIPPFTPAKAPSAAARRDFVRWYHAAMTEFSRWWVGTTRRIMGDTQIYLCTGGAGEPELGADFTAQAKVIARYGAGIRITNEASSYPHNYAVTREVATATRLYDTYAGFEPAGQVTADGIAPRVYNATASGARELHFYLGNIFDSGAALANFAHWVKLLEPRQPRAPRVAVYIAREHWVDNRLALDATYAVVRALREHCDLDLVTEDSVRDGALAQVKLLVVPTPGEIEAEAALRRYAEGGGLVVRAADDAQWGPPVAERQGPAPAVWQLHLGVPGDDAFLEGVWYGPETAPEFPEGTRGKRWSGADPAIRVPVEPGRAYTLEIEAAVSGHSLADGGEVVVSWDGRRLGTLTQGYQRAHFELPASWVTEPVARLAIDVPTWVPAERDGTTDARVLGVSLSGVTLRQAGAPATATPVTNQGVLWAYRGPLPAGTTVGRGKVLRVPFNRQSSLEQGRWLTILNSLAPELIEDDAYDLCYVTHLSNGRLWLNQNNEPRTKGGVTVPAHGIALGP